MKNFPLIFVILVERTPLKPNIQMALLFLRISRMALIAQSASELTMSATSAKQSVDKLFLLTDYRTWYLSGHGDDTEDCGRAPSQACHTLHKILTMYYSNNTSPSAGLHISTDTSFLVDMQTQVNVFVWRKLCVYAKYRM